MRETIRKCCPSLVKKESSRSSEESEVKMRSNHDLDVLEHLSEEDKMKKAIRHFYDGYKIKQNLSHLLRTPRNDIDGPEH